MIDIAKSLASLVKTNNGFFKSVLQAKFLSDVANGETYVTAGVMRGNHYSMTYFLDDEGVYRVEKYTYAKGFVIQWEREVEGVVSSQAEKEIKRCKRALKALEKEIAQRDREYRAGEYTSALMFAQHQARDIENVQAWKARIVEYGGKA